MNMRIKSFLIITSTLFVVWLVLNGSLNGEVLISGAVVSILTSLLFCSSCNIFEEIRITPKALIYSIVYIFVFIRELVKSNLDVALRVISPNLPINPGIVEVQTKLKSKVGRMILANSITLTPGTFTVEMTGDRLFIHWIDVKSTDIEEDTKMIVRTFEKYLEVIYG
jgi:multicomponent Na+:H+ antiporter subunit E